MKRWQKVLIAIVVVIGGAVYWLFYDNRPGADTARLDLGELRAAAAAIPGELPESIAVERVAAGDLPATFLVAGGGFGTTRQGVHAFRIGWPDRHIVLDTGMDREAAKALSVYTLDDAAQQRVWAALPGADAILVSHEHLDHIGGLLTAPDWAAVAPKAQITRGQFDHPELTEPVQWPRDSRDGFRPVDYRGMRSVAPGVVAIEAASHTPGSQLLFVRLKDGREYLFPGDISSMDRNWRETRARSRFIGEVLIDEDRAAVFRWLKAFRALAAADPKLIVVPTHDAGAIDRLVGQGALTRGFR